MPPSLTKSEFLRSLGCVRRLWLDKNRPDLKPPTSLNTMERMRVGLQVGDLARLRYPCGVFVPRSDDPASATQELLERHDCIFEATFASEGRQARVDVLWKAEDGSWTIDEVKSSTIKPLSELERGEKAMDLAFQVLTASRATLDVGAARLVLVDSSYRWQPPGEANDRAPLLQPSLFDIPGTRPSGSPRGDSTEAPFDPELMLGAVDLTQAVGKLMPNAERLAAEAIAALASPEEPEVETNTHCKDCDFFPHCHQDRPRHEVIYLPGIRAKEVKSMRALGYETIDQIPDEFGLNEARLRVKKAILTGEPQIGPALGSRLEEIEFPAAFIDYETTNSAFPLFAGTRPYQQICFQWSAHVMDSAESKPVHLEFLSTDRIDPRPEFCRSLLEAVRNCRSIIHYTGFEIRQVEGMVKDEIPLAENLLGVLESNSIDLHKIVSNHVYLLEFGRSTSIKVVLPALVPSMSYKDMLIGDGLAAALGYREMTETNCDPARKAELKEALLKYCEQDTLAMVEIYHALRSLTPKA